MRTDRQTEGLIELPFANTRFSPCAQEIACRTEVLDAVVACISYIDGTIRRYSHAGGIEKLALASAWTAPYAQEITRRAEVLDPVIVSIGHIHCPVRPHCHTR